MYTRIILFNSKRTKRVRLLAVEKIDKTTCSCIHNAVDDENSTRHSILQFINAVVTLDF